MAGREYRERCSCDASFECVSAEISVGALSKLIADFRTNHRHEMPTSRKLGFDTNKTGGSSISAQAGGRASDEEFAGMWSGANDPGNDDDDDDEE